MGLRGPAPTPTAILKMRGSWRGNANKKEPQVRGLPKCPVWLSKSAKRVWRQVAQHLGPLGVLTRIDANALSRYCDAFARWRAAAKWIEEKGEVYPLKDKEGNVKCLVPWPHVAIYTTTATLLTRLEQEFGLTPSSRSRIQVSPDEDAAVENSKSRFFPAGPATKSG